MIQVDYQNSLSAKIGPKNGLDKVFLRNFLKKNQPLVETIFKDKKTVGYSFLDLPDDLKMSRAIEAFAEKNKKWENIVVLGIGGSALGGIALQESLLGPLHNFQKKPRLFFVDNVDPDWVAPLMAMIDFKKTLFIVVSKSGGTTEPMALYSVVRKKLGRDFRNHLVFVTDPKEGLLRKMGEREKIAMFDIPAKVGGRFSVLTAASMLPARLAGIDISKIMFGARKMREMIQETKLEKNPALLLACLQFVLDTKKAKPMTVVMPYSNLLFRTADWYRQLLAESIGKNPKTGPTPINALGTTDQHSQLQLYNEGPANKWFIFLKVVRHASELKLGSDLPNEMGFLNGLGMEGILNASLDGTAEALAKNGRPNITLALEKIDEMSVGALMMLMEFQVALLGLLYKVNAFDQPGVEQSKKITKQILSKKTQ